MNITKQCKYGIMSYNINDEFIGKSLSQYGEFSEGEVELFEKIITKEMTVLDVGANIGTHTVVFSRLANLVFAYEPQRLMYYLLCSNISLNNLTNVYCFQNAVGRIEGRIDVPELDPNKENNFGGINLMLNTPNCNKCSVKLTKIDSQNLERVDFIKIDVEGMEADVLKGAEQTIKSHRPFIYAENDRSERMSLLVKLIYSFDYEIYFHAPPLYNKNNYAKNPHNIFGNIVSINMFCHPKEKPLTFDPKEFGLNYLKKDGKVILKKNLDNAKQVHENVTDNVIKSCIDASIYYSENLCEHDKALAFTEMAMKVNMEDWRGYYQASMTLCKMYDYTTALKFVDLALERNPDHFKAILNRATILAGIGRYPEAIEQYKEALKKEPNSANVHFYMACAMIAINDPQGFKEHEWRFQLPKVQQFMNLLPNVPMWEGQSLKNKKILLFCEQGGGDLVQHIRYTKKLGGHKTLATPDSMSQLLKGCQGIDNFIQFNSNDATILSGEYDYICSLMSMPKFFGIDTTQKYIKPTKSKFKVSKDFNVGIVWAGNDMHESDCFRSCPLKYFDILKMPGVKFYSLQKGEMKRNWMSEGAIDLMADSSLEYEKCELNDFNDTANIMQHLDLIITVDTAVAHIAGAIGAPVWLLLGFYPDHRWGLEKTDTHWYPSMKIFRQLNYGKDWSYVLENVRKELLEFSKK